MLELKRSNKTLISKETKSFYSTMLELKQTFRPNIQFSKTCFYSTMLELKPKFVGCLFNKAYLFL